MHWHSVFARVPNAIHGKLVKFLLISMRMQLKLFGVLSEFCMAHAHSPQRLMQQDTCAAKLMLSPHSMQGSHCSDRATTAMVVALPSGNDVSQCQASSQQQLLVLNLQHTGHLFAGLCVLLPQ